MRKTRDLGVIICLIFAAMVAGCAGDRMSRARKRRLMIPGCQQGELRSIVTNRSVGRLR
jgi:hypothetical protein